MTSSQEELARNLVQTEGRCNISPNLILNLDLVKCRLANLFLSYRKFCNDTAVFCENNKKKLFQLKRAMMTSSNGNIFRVKVLMYHGSTLYTYDRWATCEIFQADYVLRSISYGGAQQLRKRRDLTPLGGNARDIHQDGSRDLHNS